MALTWQNLVPNGQRRRGRVPARGHRHPDQDHRQQRAAGDGALLHPPRRHRGRRGPADQSSRWTLPAAPRPALALDRHPAQPERRRCLHRRVPGVLALQAGVAYHRLGRRRAGIRPGQRQRGRGGLRAGRASRWRVPIRCIRAASTWRGPARHRARAIGIFDAQEDDIGILSDRPDDLLNATTGQTVGQLPLCERTLGDDGSDLSLGRPERPLHPGQRRARYRGPERRQRPQQHRARTTTSSATSCRCSPAARTTCATAAVGGRPGPGLQVGALPGADAPADRHHRHAEPAPDPADAPDRRGAADAGEPDVVARSPWPASISWGPAWVRRSETPDRRPGGLAGQAHRRGDRVDRVHRERDRPGIHLAAGRVRGDPEAGSGHLQRRADQRAVAPRDRPGAQPGDRGEAYLRFPAGPQNMLAYRELRFWARGRGPGWEERELEAFIKVGSDDRNFYLYRAPAHTTTWEPEMVVDLDVWRELRAQVEQRWLSGAPPSGSAACGTNDPNAYVACKGPYLVHLGDPGINPPNLAAAQELSTGIYRVGGRATHPNRSSGSTTSGCAGPVSETGNGGVLRHPPGRVRRRQRERLVHPPGWAVPADQRGPDLPHHRRACARHPLAARSVPPDRTRHHRADQRHLCQGQRGPAAAHRHRSPGGGAARPAEAGELERDLRLRPPAERQGDRLAHPQPAGPACRSTWRTPRATPRPSIRRRRAATRSWRSPTTCRCAGAASGCRWAGWWTACPRWSARARPGGALRSGTFSLVPSNLRLSSTLVATGPTTVVRGAISRPTDGSVRPRSR